MIYTLYQVKLSIKEAEIGRAYKKQGRDDM
jgi:hypothetical protein